MSVELITHNPNEILDLTGGSNEPEIKEENLEPEEPTLTPPLEEDAPAATPPADEPPAVETTTEEPKEGEEEPDDSEYFFGGSAVNIDVPAEISTALADAGVDEKALLGELFKKDGDFSLTDETRTKLEEKFGKLMVDGYLNMYKGMNEQSMAKAAADSEATALQEKKRDEEYATAVGGEEGLLKMEDYIVGAFSEDQVAAYNAVMESGDHASQMLIISQVKMQMELQDKLTNGDTKVSLLGDKDSSAHSASPLDKGYLTASEYNAIMDTDKYWDDKEYMRQVDAARTAGFKHDA
ncbi:head scaffolding protein [Vibrio phage D530]